MEAEILWNKDRIKERCLYIHQFVNEQMVITNSREDIECMVRKLMKEYGNAS